MPARACRRNARPVHSPRVGASQSLRCVHRKGTKPRRTLLTIGGHSRGLPNIGRDRCNALRERTHSRYGRLGRLRYSSYSVVVTCKPTGRCHLIQSGRGRTAANHTPSRPQSASADQESAYSHVSGRLHGRMELRAGRKYSASCESGILAGHRRFRTTHSYMRP